jgi:hypothetical protein
VTKALWYVDHKETNILAVRMANEEIGFYFLIKDNSGGVKKITTTSGQLKFINGPHAKSAETRPILEVTIGFRVENGL